MAAFGIGHPVYTDSVSDVDVRHVLRRDQYVLLPVGGIGGIDLQETGTSECDVCRTQVHHEHTIIFILIRRLTASMNTSNSSKKGPVRSEHLTECKKSQHVPRQRIGHPMDSHKERRRQMVENDFSPPLRDRGSFSRLLFCVRFWSSVLTCKHVSSHFC